MTPAQLNTLINYKCKTNDTTFTLATKLPLVNMFKDEISSLIAIRAPSYFLVPSTFDLVADQREYGFGDDLLNSIYKLEIRFTSTANRQPATFLKDYRGSEVGAEIIKKFSNQEGEFAYTIRRRAVFILSGTIVAVTGGGRLQSHIYPANLANLTDTTGMEVDPSTTTFGFPRQFHELLARRVAIEWKTRNNKALAKKDMDYEIDLEAQLAAISNIEQTGQTVASLPDAQDLWDDGFNC